jgi:DNA gyrase subunit B
MKKKLSGSISITNPVQKFVDCRSRDVDRREIYIVEGDSALGACKQSRDAEFQGIMPVRGKILNCLKADYVRIFKSDVITDLIKVLGCGVEVKDKHTKDVSSFDLNNLRWNKVIICTDADVDGFQIRTLILTMLYRLTPTLIREGYVYIAESPLYEIESKGKTYFAYSDREKAEIIDSLKGAKATINRSKGLGENEPEMMWMTTMNPETRRLIKVIPEDAERMAEVFDLLLGDNLEGRKNHISEFGAQFLDLADIS